ncbi:thioesterase family protein [Variovorax sp.]|jgi:hypothetical protein|uniref:thioesterase family protein n=1 Tax=Variovorax sp. TaxID=1871043 RepID=UPI0037D9F60C
MHELAATDAVFVREDANTWRASELARGPWDPRAQHGGAPCGLLAHIAESAVEGEGWQLARLTVELIRPVPVDLLLSAVATEAGRTTARVEISLLAQGKPVAKAHALLVRTQPVVPPEEALQRPLAPALSMPAPSDCTAPLRIPGLPDVRSFYYTATESRVAAGDAAAPGPAAAWFRLRVPLVAGAANSPAMRAAAAADFGNGLSWVLPVEHFNFANADLSLQLARQPVGDWIGLDAVTTVAPDGSGCTFSQLHDERGRFGFATQTLLVFAR